MFATYPHEFAKIHGFMYEVYFDFSTLHGVQFFKKYFANIEHCLMLFCKHFCKEFLHHFQDDFDAGTGKRTILLINHNYFISKS